MNTTHTVQAFDKDLEKIVSTILEMGDRALAILDICHSQILAPEESKDKGKVIAESAKKQDRQINKLDFEVQEMATYLIALRQPLGEDLRYATASMRIANSAERIGDLAKSISARMVGSVAKIDNKIQQELTNISEKSIEMVKKSITSFKEKDASLAEEVIDLDDIVDDIYVSMTGEIQAAMVQDSTNAKAMSQILFVFKNFERIGDHATTIADSVLYIASGNRN